MDWRTAHRARVERLEAEATAVMLDALGPIMATVAGQFAVVATTAAAGDDAQARASLDDLGAIDVQWRAAVHDQVLPWFAQVYETGAAAAVDQVVGLGIAVLDVDPALMSHAAATYLEGVQNRFYPLGEAAWAAAREELVAGFAEGEGIDALRRRITDVTDLTARQAEVLARTEVIAASNMGAQARVDLMGDNAPPYRQWLSTMDGRTRPTHRAADGQVRPKGEAFDVGGSSLMVPGDPGGPAREVVNCRCTVIYTESADPLLAEGRQQGGIVDEVATEPLAAAVHVGTEPEVLATNYVELVMADVARYRADYGRPDENHAERIAWLEGVLAAAEQGPPQVDSTTGEPHTGAMVALIPADPEAWAVAQGEPPDAIHLTLAYLGDGADIPDPTFEALLAGLDVLAAELPPVEANVFGAATWNMTGEGCMVLQVGGAPLQPARDAAWLTIQRAGVANGEAAVWQPPEQHTPWVAHICLSYDPDPAGTVQQVAQQFEGPVTFDRIRLTRGAEAFDFALTGAPPEEDIDMDRAAIAAIIDEAFTARLGPLTAAVEPGPAASGDPTSADTDDTGPPAQPGEHLRAVMHQQGTPTGLRDSGRVFTNMTYRDTPFAYHVQTNSSAHGGTPKVVPVGLVTRIVQTDDGDYGFVRLDLDNPEAAEHARRAVAGFDRWVSIGADETMATTTLVWPAPGETPDLDAEPIELDPDEPVEEVLLQPQKVIIDGANVAELTAVSTPAQADAVLEPTAELMDLFGSVAPVPEADVVLASAHDDCGGACGGACGCGPVDVEAPEVGVVTRLFQAEAALTAAAKVIELTNLPPASWFKEPTDVEITSALAITDSGRIYGLLAPYGTNHRAHARSGKRVEAPRGNVDYSRFMGRWAVTDEGNTPAGPITMDCGHAAMHRADHQVAVDHYDNTCSIIGAVAVGESDTLGGTWIAGAVLPGTTAAQLARALACACSGDWQPHPDKAGWQELVACLLVPAPGFAMPHAHATTSYKGDALVASTVPVVHVATAEVEAARRRALTVSRLVAGAGRTPAARVAAAVARARG